nr:homolog of E3 ubiquitin-protein ligase and RGHV1 ORF4 MIR-like membrane protein [Macronycteris gammaherpesvirus 1]
MDQELKNLDDNLPLCKFCYSSIEEQDRNFKPCRCKGSVSHIHKGSVYYLFFLKF